VRDISEPRWYELVPVGHGESEPELTFQSRVDIILMLTYETLVVGEVSIVEVYPVKPQAQPSTSIHWLCTQASLL
jgi:hypothetical protein